MRVVLMLFFVLLPSLANAAPPGHFVARCFPSGFKVAVEERPGQPLAGVAMLVGGGSSLERPDEAGVAHLVEHLWFRRPSGTFELFSYELDMLGAWANAFTTHDETVFLTVAHTRALKTLMEREAQRLRDPLAGITKTSFSLEREVVRAEIRQRYDGGNPLFSAVLEATVDGHPYARRVSGLDEEVQTLTPKTARAYVRRAYVPSNASLFVAGDVKTADILQLVKQTFGPALLAKPNAPDKIDPRGCPSSAPVYGKTASTGLMTPSEEVVTVKAGVSARMAVLAWPMAKGPAPAHRARKAAELMEVKLVADLNRDGSCAVAEMQDMNTLLCAVELKETENGPRYLSRLVRVFKTMWNDASDPAYHRERWMQNWVLSGEYNRRARRAAFTDRLDTSSQGHLATSVKQLHWLKRRFEGKRLDAGSAVHVGREELGPVRKILVEPMAGSDLHRALHAARSDPRGSRVRGASLPNLGGEMGNPLKGIRTLKFQGGLEVWLMPRSDAKRDRLTVVFPTDPGQETTTVMAADLHLATPSEWLEQAGDSVVWPRNGAFLSSDHNDRLWRVTVVPRDFEDGARWIKQIMKVSPTLLKRRRVKRRIRDLQEYREKIWDDPEIRASVVQWRKLGGRGPGFLEEAGLEAVVEVSRDEVSALAKKQFSWRRGRLLAVVRGDLDQAEAALRQRFEKLKVGATTPPPLPQPARAANRSITVVPHRPTTKASIEVACHVQGENSLHDWVLQSLLQRRLNRTLRNDMGATYGVSASTVDQPHGRTLTIATEVPPDLAGKALKTILGGITAVRKGKVPDLDRIKLHIARRMPLWYQTVSDVERLLERLYLEGQDPTEYDPATQLGLITAPALANSIAPCVGYEAVTVVGDPSYVGKALRNEGFGLSPMPRDLSTR